MVKRLLSVAFVAFFAVLSLQAQQLQRDPSRRIATRQSRAMQAPRKAASLDGTTAWYLTDGEDWGGLGIGVTGAQFSVAIFVPGDGLLKGSTINGIKVPVIDAGMTDASAWVRSSLSGANLASVALSGPYAEGEFATVALDEPVAIPEAGVYVGFTFTNSTVYAIPIDYYGEPVAGGLFLDYVYQGQDYGWSDYSLDFPATPIQVLIAGLTLPDYNVQLNSVGSSSQLPSSAFTLPVTFTSNSAKEITSLDVDLTVDGKTESKHIALSTPIASGFSQVGSFTVSGTSPAQTGLFDAVVRVTKVNGNAYAEESQATGSLKNLTRLAQRRTAIEEFTGTGCGYCPRGWVGMEYMKEQYPETFVGIAFHKYNSSDALYYGNYPLLGMSGAPGCVIDRKEEADPYYGNTDYDLGIEIDFKRLNAEAPDVDVNVEAQWNEDQTQVEINANVEFLIAPQDISLVYVLTADSLTGTASSWKQSNYYVQYTAAQVGNAQGIVDFCQGGKYGSSSVSLVFNDAVIASSYDANMENQGPTVTSADGYKAGSFYEASYTLASPTKATVKTALKKHLVTAAVLVIDNQTGEVLNAGKTRVGTADAIHDVYNPTTTSLSARYNMAGQAIATPQRGVNIIRMSDGSVRKVLVK